MSEISDVVFTSDDMSDIVLGKSDGISLKIIVNFAFIILLSLLVTWGGSYFIEQNRLTMIIQEVRDISEMAYNYSVSTYQNVNVEDYLYIEGTNQLSESYDNYLSILSNTASMLNAQELLEVTKYLRYGSSRTDTGLRSEYTPLSFGLSYLDINEVKKSFNNIIEEQLKDVNGETTNSNVFNLLFIGLDKVELLSTNVILNDISVYDITNINSNQFGITSEENKRRKELFYMLYGTTDSSVVNESNIVRITGKKYVIAYDLTFEIVFRPFTNTEWFRKTTWRQSTRKTNSFGYYEYGQMKYSFDKVYCISN